MVAALRKFDPRRFIAAVSLSSGIAFGPAVDTWLAKTRYPSPVAAERLSPFERSGDVTLGVFFEDAGNARIGQTVDLFRCGGCTHTRIGHRLNHRLARVLFRRSTRPGFPGLLGLSLDPRDAARVKEWLHRGDESEFKEKLRAVRTTKQTPWKDRSCRGGFHSTCIGRWRD